MNYLKSENNRIQHNHKQNHNNNKVEQELESVKSQNIYMESEISQLTKQIKDLTLRYRNVIDQKNRVTVDTIVSKRNCLPNADAQNLKTEIMILKTKNKEFKVKAKGSQLKDTEINELRRKLKISHEENLYVKERVMDLNKQILEIKQSHCVLENENSQSSKNMLNWWKNLYKEKVNECKIYLEKISEFQKQNNNFQNVSYTKKVFQSKVFLIN